ncbi:MAG: hypothetical protein R2712_05045 [Vicinamibacterales bacterium]
MTRAAIVLQARMGSTRLPGKVLAQLGRRSILAHCVERLRLRSGLPVVVATTERPEDDAVCAAASAVGAAVLRGPEQDVLARYVLAAETYGLTHVVRATADNPAVDIDAPRRTLDMLLRTGVGHVGEYGLPLGAAVEACTTRRLAPGTGGDGRGLRPRARHAVPQARPPRAGAGVAGAGRAAPAGHPAHRGSADDLATIRDIFDLLGPHAGTAPLGDIIDAADRVRPARDLMRGVLVR